MAYILGLFDSTKMADGTTLLDNAVVYWFQRHGDGGLHANTALPNVIAGGAGGYFRTGRYLTIPRTSNTRLLLSIAAAMGVQFTTFGVGAGQATDPVAGLTA